MSAPGITLEQFSNPDMLTKSNEYGLLIAMKIER